MPNLSEADAYDSLMQTCTEYGASLVAVSKSRPEQDIKALYQRGQRKFGENRAHELIIKASLLPSDIEWQLIGHLQTNKVKSVIQYASCIQSVDSLKLWRKINEEAAEASLHVPCLLQIHIAAEETKYGWEYGELENILKDGMHDGLDHVIIKGLMGMSTLTNDESQIRSEFRLLKKYFERIKSYFAPHSFDTLSMGMSGDYKIALEEGSNMIRVGSLLFA